MIVALRADASIEIGSGHIMRCLTLAEALSAELQATCHFICREHKSNLITFIESKGFEVIRLPHNNNHINTTDSLAHSKWLGTTQKNDAATCESALKLMQPDWLIVDHYAIDAQWEIQLKPYYKKLFVIDDLADRNHITDVLLDQNFGRKEEDYSRLVPKQCKLFIGPEYALLRPEFSQWREHSLARRKNIEAPKFWLINLGGVDKDNITSKVLLALSRRSLLPDTHITVVMGTSAPHTESIKNLAKSMPWPCEVLINVSNMAELMANADIAVGAAGSTSWERICLGLPTILLTLAANQQEIAQRLLKSGSVWLSSTENIQQTLNRILEDPDLRVKSRNAFDITAGMGMQNILEAMDAKES